MPTPIEEAKKRIKAQIQYDNEFYKKTLSLSINPINNFNKEIGKFLRENEGESRSFLWGSAISNIRENLIKDFLPQFTEVSLEWYKNIKELNFKTLEDDASQFCRLSAKSSVNNFLNYFFRDLRRAYIRESRAQPHSYISWSGYHAGRKGINSQRWAKANSQRVSSSTKIKLGDKTKSDFYMNELNQSIAEYIEDELDEFSDKIDSVIEKEVKKTKSWNKLSQGEKWSVRRESYLGRNYLKNSKKKEPYIGILGDKVGLLYVSGDDISFLSRDI